MPDKPFFIYLRAGRHARAAPRAEGVDRQVQGQVRPGAGTSCARRPSRARRSWACIPADAALTERPGEIPAWTTCPATLKPILARQMEVYAGVPRAHRPSRRPADSTR